MTEHKQNGFPMALLLIALLYGGMTILAGVVGNKQVSIGPLAIEAGIFPFLTLVAMSSAVSELYGQDMAKKIILFGFAPLLFSIVLIFFINALPASHEMNAERLKSFNMVMGQAWRFEPNCRYIIVREHRLLWRIPNCTIAGGSDDSQNHFVDHLSANFNANFDQHCAQYRWR